MLQFFTAAPPVVAAVVAPSLPRSLAHQDRLLSKQTPSPRRGGPAHPSPATFMRVSDQLMAVRVSPDNLSGGFAPASVKRALSKVLSESLPAWSGTFTFTPGAFFFFFVTVVLAAYSLGAIHDPE